MQSNHRFSLRYAFTLSILSLGSFQLMSRAALSDVSLPADPHLYQALELEPLSNHKPSLTPASPVLAATPLEVRAPLESRSLESRSLESGSLENGSLSGSLGSSHQKPFADSCQSRKKPQRLHRHFT